MTKLKFKRLMRKKWLYPAVYLTVAALVLVGVFWYQQSSNDVADQLNDESQVENDVFVNEDGEEAVPVTSQGENLEMPVTGQEEATIVTKFFDYGATDEEQESALVLYNNKYYQSKGVDITKNEGEAFEVTAALSGAVTEVKEDPLYGNVVELTHDNEVTTVYSSLADIQVKSGDEVEQGDVLGQASQSSFGKDSGVHVHFEVRKDDQPVNPENFFGQAVSSIEAAEAVTEDGTDGSEDSEEATEEDAPEEELSETDLVPELDQDETPEGEDQGTQSDDSTENEEDADLEDPTVDEDSSSSRSTTQS
ncbi:peptidoglycan DD-metalloendopeptidase family protein [Halobacillus campisalis]|uniref:Peptidoglycan DD-metalloendopeptidase family protein n=1 Tax=Halobacillus campisalis TaxID=435909 RepID=A0ABW2JZK4_9BACI|nr:peptidoglycan DD-metalloendopeptidase family protein [Halobacillus campisalis]